MDDSDLIKRQRRRRRRRYGEDYSIIRDRENGSSRKKEYIPIADRHIDGA